MQKKWRVVTEICSKPAIKTWVSWQWYVTFQSPWLKGSEPSPKATGRDIASVIWTIWTLKLKETQVLEQAERIPPMLVPLSLFLACVHLPPTLLQDYEPHEVFHICLAWSRRYKAQSLKCTHRIFLPLQGPYTSAAAAAPGRTDPPSSPHRAPSQCGNGEGGWRQGACFKSSRSQAGRLPGWNAQLEALGGRSPGVTVILWVRYPGELSAPKGLLQHTRRRGTKHLQGEESGS